MTRAAEARTHVITGEQRQVCSALLRAREDQRLVEVTRTQVLPGDQVRVHAVLRTPTAAAPSTTPPAGTTPVTDTPAAAAPAIAARFVRWWRTWRGPVGQVLIGVAATGVVAGLVWAVGCAVQAVLVLAGRVLAWVQAHGLQLGIGAIALAVLLMVLSARAGGRRQGRSRCPGLHCGCGH